MEVQMKKQKKGFIYFIGAKTQFGERVKIGKTTRLPRLRFNALQVASPVPLYLLGFYLTNDIDMQEQWQHRMCEHERLRGEWFNVPFSIADKYKEEKNPVIKLSLDIEESRNYMDGSIKITEDLRKWYEDIKDKQ